MNNYRFDITADVRDAISIISAIGLRDRDKVVGYAVREAGLLKAIGNEREVPKRLLLFWAKPNTDYVKDFVPFAEELDKGSGALFAHDWLMLTQNDEEEPDIDGSVNKGFRLYNEAWGHVDGMWQACAAISPAWAMYGK